GEAVHIGWSTSDHNSAFTEIYFTDCNGNRVQGATVGQAVPMCAVPPPPGDQRLRSEFHNGGNQPMFIQNVSFLQTPGQGLPLEELNLRNGPLNAQMQPAPGGTFVINPGQTVNFVLPFVDPPNTAVLLRYDVVVPGSTAQITDYAQWTNAPLGLRGD